MTQRDPKSILWKDELPAHPSDLHSGPVRKEFDRRHRWPRWLVGKEVLWSWIVAAVIWVVIAALMVG